MSIMLHNLIILSARQCPNNNSVNLSEAKNLCIRQHGRISVVLAPPFFRQGNEIAHRDVANGEFDRFDYAMTATLPLQVHPCRERE